MAFNPPGPTILLAEDDVYFRYACARFLRQHGFHVIEAADGMEAVEISRCTTGKIDLLLSDVNMPRIDGLMAAVAIQEQRPEIKVLLMTAVLPVRPGQIEKPAEIETLLGDIHKLLDRQPFPEN